MPRKIRNNKRRTALDSDALAWLDGKKTASVFYPMKPAAELEEVWLAHGDHENFFWRRGMSSSPITHASLQDHEDDWLLSGEGDGDRYGAESYFIWKLYTDEEKTKLWNAHGQKELYKWAHDLRRPIPIGADENAARLSFATIGPFDIA